MWHGWEDDEVHQVAAEARYSYLALDRELLEVLQHLGFGQIWRDIISGLLSSSFTQVLLNGIPGECITHGED